MAHFAATPLADGQRRAPEQAALVVAGLDQAFPDVGRCTNPSAYPSLPLASLPELRLLDAGEVTISSLMGSEQAASSTIVLAPRAFPSISSLASGVVYTSRDRDAQGFPSGALYQIRIAGGDQVAGMQLRGRAPRELTQVTVGGVPLEQVEQVAVSQPMDVTWDVGSPSDVVYVDVLSVDAASTALRCSFNDADGAATISPELLAAFRAEPVVLSLHRQRTLIAEPESLGQQQATRLRFDFELSHVVEFVR